MGDTIKDVKDYETRRKLIVDEIIKATKEENMPLALCKGNELKRLESEFKGVLEQEEDKKISALLEGNAAEAVRGFVHELYLLHNNGCTNSDEIGKKLYEVFRQEFALLMHRVKVNGTMVDMLYDLGYRKAPKGEDEQEQEVQEPVGAVQDPMYMIHVLEGNQWGFVSGICNATRSFMLTGSTDRFVKKFRTTAEAEACINILLNDVNSCEKSLKRRYDIVSGDMCYTYKPSEPASDGDEGGAPQADAKAVIFCLGEQNLFGFVRSVEEDGCFLLCASVENAMKFDSEDTAREAIERIVGNETKHKCNLWKTFNVLLTTGTEMTYKRKD